VAGCCECGDEPSGSCALELVLVAAVNMAKFVDNIFIDFG
jgi:hypothetical protein